MQCKKEIERMEYRWQKEEDGECEERNGGEIVYYYGKLHMQKKKKTPNKNKEIKEKREEEKCQKRDFSDVSVFLRMFSHLNP